MKPTELDVKPCPSLSLFGTGSLEDPPALPRQEGTKVTIFILLSRGTELERNNGRLRAPQHRESGHEPMSLQIQGQLVGCLDQGSGLICPSPVLRMTPPSVFSHFTWALEAQANSEDWPMLVTHLKIKYAARGEVFAVLVLNLGAKLMRLVQVSWERNDEHCNFYWSQKLKDFSTTFCFFGVRSLVSVHRMVQLSFQQDWEEEVVIFSKTLIPEITV